LIVTNDTSVINSFENAFPIVREDKYLGRELAIDDDGFLIADDRFYDKNMWHIKAIPSFNVFGVKRLLFMTALDAKYRYRFMVWSCNKQYIRGCIFKSNWYYFKSYNDKYSYLQMVFVIFNVFRVFIDAGQIDALIKDVEKGISKDILQEKLIEKLITGIEVIDKAIRKIKINIKYVNHDNKTKQAKKFLNELFEQFKNHLLNDFLQDKKEEHIDTFTEIKSLTKSKYYNNFLIIQNICFNHRNYDMNKQILVFMVLESFINEKISKIYDLNKRQFIINDITKLDILNWSIKPICIPKNEQDVMAWNNFINIHNTVLWKLLIFIIDLDKLKYKKKIFLNY